MDYLQIYINFNSVSVISGLEGSDNERLCAMEPRLRLKCFSPPSRIEPGTSRSAGLLYGIDSFVGCEFVLWASDLRGRHDIQHFSHFQSVDIFEDVSKYESKNSHFSPTIECTQIHIGFVTISANASSSIGLAWRIKDLIFFKKIWSSSYQDVCLQVVLL